MRIGSMHPVAAVYPDDTTHIKPLLSHQWFTIPTSTEVIVNFTNTEEMMIANFVSYEDNYLYVETTDEGYVRPFAYDVPAQVYGLTLIPQK